MQRYKISWRAATAALAVAGMAISVSACSNGSSKATEVTAATTRSPASTGSDTQHAGITHNDALWFLRHESVLDAVFTDYGVDYENGHYFVISERAQETASDMAAVLRLLPSMPSPGLRANWTQVVNRFRIAARDAYSSPSGSSAMYDANAAYGKMYNQLVAVVKRVSARMAHPDKGMNSPVSVADWYNTYGDKWYTQITSHDPDPYVYDAWVPANFPQYEQDLNSAAHLTPIPDQPLNRAWQDAISTLKSAVEQQNLSEFERGNLLFARIYNKLLLIAEADGR
jgi:hypothetical protein